MQNSLSCYIMIAFNALIGKKKLQPDSQIIAVFVPMVKEAQGWFN